MSRVRGFINTAFIKANPKLVDLAKKIRKEMSEHISTEQVTAVGHSRIQGNIATPAFETEPQDLPWIPEWMQEERTGDRRQAHDEWFSSHGYPAEEQSYDYPAEISNVHAAVGLRRMNEGQQGGVTQRARFDHSYLAQREEQPVVDAGQLGSRPREICVHHQQGRCRFGGSCLDIHQIGEVNVKMSPYEHQQYQQAILAGQQRSMEAASHHQQGTYPSMHPTGAYAARPPQPMGAPPTGRGNYGGRGLGPIGGRGYAAGRGGRFH